ncbi:hypothetical protein J3459_010115 [Metarhizium acridum]|nr:hypothetical protein J3459_010115 [Metarhizium acridum]
MLEPIAKLILEATEMYCNDMKKKTIIYRPELMEHIHRATSWKVATMRPKRSMATIMLPDEIKNLVLNDMIEFLKPQTARWYADRGIPWRRGYLFFGPPGTGKTSFVAAIAAHLGLDVHILDLSEPHMTDANLLRLFRTLPPRRIALIEDIDVSGIQRDGDSKGAETNRVAANRRFMITESFSFSGLLNAIDGMAAEEGRILIMTTNKRELLDEALSRPGRVDIQIEFHNATSQQSEALYCQIYGDFTPLKPNNGALPAKKGIKDQKDDKDEKLVASAASQIDKVAVSPEEIKRLSKEFSKKIPDFLCSPAEIQEFLLCRKKHPQKALDDVERWVEGMAKRKNSGSNLRMVH